MHAHTHANASTHAHAPASGSSVVPFFPHPRTMCTIPQHRSSPRHWTLDAQEKAVLRCKAMLPVQGRAAVKGRGTSTGPHGRASAALSASASLSASAALSGSSSPFHSVHTVVPDFRTLVARHHPLTLTCFSYWFWQVQPCLVQLPAIFVFFVDRLGILLILAIRLLDCIPNRASRKRSLRSCKAGHHAGHWTPDTVWLYVSA